MAASENTLNPVESLFNAIHQADINAIEEILDKHPDIVNTKHQSKDGWGMCTPLMEACFNHSTKWPVVTCLLKRGADPNATGYVLRTHKLSHLGQPTPKNAHFRFFQDGFGVFDDRFPLFIAAGEKNELMILVLLQIGGANVNQATAMGETALHRACQCHDEKTMMPPELANKPGDSIAMSVVRKLIEKGADVNRPDAYDRTPLHHACQSCSPYFVEILLENGADVTLRDCYNRTALEYAALHKYNQVEVILKKCHISRQARIEAYELSALESRAPEAYKTLQKALRLRKKHRIPRQILPPLECYDFVKECENLEELRAIENNPQQITVQALLARERIFHGRGFDLLDDSTRQTIKNSGLTNMTALHYHHMDLVEERGEYLEFGDTFILSNDILASFFYENYPAMAMKNDVIWKTVEMIFKSLHKIQEDLIHAKKPGVIAQLISQFYQTMLYVTFFIIKLLQRGSEEDQVEKDGAAQPQEGAKKRVSTKIADFTLAAEIFDQTCRRFPVLISPHSGYRAPLPHVMLDKQYRTLFVDFDYPDDYHMILKMFLDDGLDVDATDSGGNTLLHVIVACSSPDKLLVKLLLENGAHCHFRNKLGKTPLDIVKNPDIKESEEVIQLLEEHVRLLTLKCIAAKKVVEWKMSCQDESLPESLIKFVNLH